MLCLYLGDIMANKNKRCKKDESLRLIDNLNNSYDVQKSTPLFSLWTSDLTLQEFKILDTYLSRIDSRKPEQRNVRFEKGELEKLLDVKQIKTDELKQRLKHLMEHVVELKDKRKKNGFVLISLFSMAICEKDDNGLWQVDLSCTAEAMEYFFNIDEIGYLRYKLRNVIHISSRYSYVLFTYLESNRFRKTWEVDLEELKQILNCGDDSTYNSYKYFNDKILKRCQKELTDKTELRYSYEPIKKGRKVVKIKFMLESLTGLTSNLDTIYPQQLSLEDTVQDDNSNFEFLRSACDNEFSLKEIKVIFNMINTMNIPDNPMGVWFARYHYLAEKYSMLNLAADRTNIRDRFCYFKAIINNDRQG